MDVKEVKQMELTDTVAGMLSNDYKERFIAEYQQVKIRRDKLQNMVNRWDNPNVELAFTPTCPRSTYDLQIRAMNDYIAVLEARAVMEGVTL